MKFLFLLHGAFDAVEKKKEKGTQSMDVHINEINSMVHIRDEQEVLNPSLLQQIVQAVLVRLRQEQKLEHYIENECDLDLQQIGSTQDWR